MQRIGFVDVSRVAGCQGRKAVGCAVSVAGALRFKSPNLVDAPWRSILRGRGWEVPLGDVVVTVVHGAAEAIDGEKGVWGAGTRRRSHNPGKGHWLPVAWGVETVLVDRAPGSRCAEVTSRCDHQRA